MAGLDSLPFCVGRIREVEAAVRVEYKVVGAVKGLAVAVAIQGLYMPVRIYPLDVPRLIAAVVGNVQISARPKAAPLGEPPVSAKVRLEPSGAMAVIRPPPVSVTYSVPSEAHTGPSGNWSPSVSTSGGIIHLL